MINLDKLKTNWKSPFVSRESLEKFSGGIINCRTMRNLDCQKKGIPNRFRIGRKIVYSVDDVIDWLKSKYEDV